MEILRMLGPLPAGAPCLQAVFRTWVSTLCQSLLILMCSVWLFSWHSQRHQDLGICCPAQQRARALPLPIIHLVQPKESVFWDMITKNLILNTSDAHNGFADHFLASTHVIQTCFVACTQSSHKILPYVSLRCTYQYKRMQQTLALHPPHLNSDIQFYLIAALYCKLESPVLHREG